MPSKEKDNSRVPSDDESNSDGEYEVEDILEYRRRGKTDEWRVRWKGYAPCDDSWETKANLSGSPDFAHKMDHLKNEALVSKEVAKSSHSRRKRKTGDEDESHINEKKERKREDHVTSYSNLDLPSNISSNDSDNNSTVPTPSNNGNSDLSVTSSDVRKLLLADASTTSKTGCTSNLIHSIPLPDEKLLGDRLKIVTLRNKSSKGLEVCYQVEDNGTKRTAWISFEEARKTCTQLLLSYLASKTVIKSKDKRNDATDISNSTKEQSKN